MRAKLAWIHSAHAPVKGQGNVLYYIEFMSEGFIKYKITVFK